MSSLYITNRERAPHLFELAHMNTHRKLGIGSIDLTECTAYGGVNVDPKNQVSEVCTTECPAYGNGRRPSLVTTAEADEEEDHTYEVVD